jgi:ferrochelatase
MTLGPHEGVLLVAHGTVKSLDELPEFLKSVRRGRPAPAALVDEMRRRYEAIGGSPLLEATRAQAAALGRVLDGPVLVAMRLWQPPVEHALHAAAELGLRRVVILPMAPFSVHVYWQAALSSKKAIMAELGPRDLELLSVDPWGLEPELITAHVELIERALATAHPESVVLLTAHSLPLRVIEAGDPYADQVARTAAAVEKRLGRRCELVYQSQGDEGGPWLGPDLPATLERIARSGAPGVVVAPIGFLAEHVETLYDLDIEAVRLAREHGLALSRVPALGSHPGLIRTLARVVERALAAPSRPEGRAPPN